MFNRYQPRYNSNTHPRKGYQMAMPSWQNTRSYSKSAPLKTCSAEQVFAAAVAAQQQNGDYLKYEQRDPETGAVVRKPNKQLMRELLEQELTPEQLAEGEAVREHYQRLLFQQMTGELKDFLVSALRVSSRESFANNDWLDLAIVAALVYWLTARGWQLYARFPDFRATGEIDPRIFRLEGAVSFTNGQYQTYGFRIGLASNVVVNFND